MKSFTKQLLVLCFIIANMNMGKAQQTLTCGSEEIRSKLYQQNPDAKSYGAIQENKLLKYIADKRANSGGGATQRTADPGKTKYVIPMVVHVIWDSQHPETNISNEQIESQIDALNKAYQENNTDISFCLAKLHPTNILSTDSSVWPSGKAGIVRINNSTAAYNNLSDAGFNNITGTIYFPHENYFNVWIVANICDEGVNCTFTGVEKAGGYAPYPIDASNNIIDGVVIKYDHFGDTTQTQYPSRGSFVLKAGYKNGGVFIHESSHYMGLYHVFQGGCTDSTDCLSNDKVCDTDPIMEDGPTCDLTATNCYGNIIDEKTVKNYMNYAPTDTCIHYLTDGQNERIIGTVESIRGTLIDAGNAFATGISCISPHLLVDVKADSVQNCTGQPVKFSVVKYSGATLQYSWEFVGGSPSTATTAGPHHITYNTPGAYTIKLTLTDSVNEQKVITKSNYIFVTDCPTITGAEASWIFPDRNILSFSNGVKTASTNVNPLLIGNEYLAHCVTQNDDSGNLLFYTTDGKTIFNRNHDTITTKLNYGHSFEFETATTNGTLQGYGGGSSQGTSVIVPDPSDLRPSNLKRYFLFMAPPLLFKPNQAYNDGLVYNVIDMSLNGGLGGMIPPFNRKVEVSNQSVMPFVTAIKHCNEQDYWIITHDAAAGTDVTKAYPVTNTGIGAPIISHTFPCTSYMPHVNDTLPYRQENWHCENEVSSDGRLAAFSYTYVDDLKKRFEFFGFYGFDRVNGTFFGKVNDGYNSLKTFYLAGGSNTLFEHPLCMSPNGKVIYYPVDSRHYAQASLSNIYAPSNNYLITNDLPNSIVNCGQNSNCGIGAMQRGPDNKIYMLNGTSKTMSVMNFPNNMNFNNSNLSGYNINGLQLKNGGLVTLPNMIDVMQGTDSADFDFSIDSCLVGYFRNKGCGTSYAWNFGDPTSGADNVSTGDNVRHEFTTYGNYQVTLTIQYGIKITTKQYTVHIPTPKKPVISGAKELCFDPDPASFHSYSVFVNDSIAYTWNFQDASPSSSTFTSVNVHWNSPGTKKIVVRAYNKFTACESTDSILINVYQPTMNVGMSRAICPNTTTVIGDTGATGGKYPYTYQWQPTSQIQGASDQSTALASPSVTTTYTLTITDSFGCKGTSSITISVSTMVIIDSLTLQQQIKCNGATTALNTYLSGAVFPVHYEFSNGNIGDLINPVSSFAAGGFTAGTYQVTVTDKCDNTSSASITITEPPAISITTTNTNVSCNSGTKGTASATVTGGVSPYTYKWTTGQTTASISNLIVGTYTVSVTDANNCLATKSVNILQTQNIDLTISSVPAACNNYPDGSATATASGGTSPYSYLWSNTATTQTIANLAVGNYTVTATDAIGCTGSQSVNVGASNSLYAAIGGPTYPCHDMPFNIGGAPTAQGGSAPYTYQWAYSTPGYTDVIVTVSDLSAENPTVSSTLPSTGRSPDVIFTVTVTDAYGCTASASKIFYVNNFGASAFNVTTCINTAANVRVRTANGTAPYTYLWSSNLNIISPDKETSDGPTIVATSSGNYSVTVTDANGCTVSATGTISVNSETFEGGADPNDGELHVSALQNNVTWGAGTRHILGIIVVPNGRTLTINGTRVEFTPDRPPLQTDYGYPLSGIVVEEGGTLNISNGAILTSSPKCGQMWEGIQVWGTKSTGNGKVNISGTSTTIENAYTAISAYRTTNTNNPSTLKDYGRGEVEASGGIFKNNRYGIVFNTWDRKHNASRIRNCTFTFDNNAALGKFAFSNFPIAHVMLQNVYAVGIMENNKFTGVEIANFDQPPYYSPFGDDYPFAPVGILSYDASYDVVAPVTELIFMETVIGLSETPPNQFSHLYKGIDAYNLGSAANGVRIRNNTFTDVQKAITLNLTVADQIISNQITNIKKPSFPFISYPDIPESYGVYTVGAKAYTGTKNTISGNSSTYTGNINGEAIFGWVAKEANGSIGSFEYDNTFNNPLDLSSQMEGDNSQLQVGCNVYNANSAVYDWRVASGTLHDPQGSCDAGDPNIARAPAGNTFSNCSSGSESQIFLQSPSSAFMYVGHSNNLPTCLSPSVTASLCAGAGAANFRNTYCPPRILTYTPLPAPPPDDIVICCDDNIGGIIGTITNIIDPIQKALLSNQIIRTLLDNNNVKGVLQLLQSLGNPQDLKLVVPGYLLSGDCASARQALNNINSTGAENIEYHRLFDMLVTACESGRKMFQLNTQEMAIAAQIAEGNTSVSLNAQSLLANINRKQYDRNPIPLSPNTNRLGNNEDQNNEILAASLHDDLTIMPNPTNGITTLQYTFTRASEGHIEVYSILGNKVKSYLLKNANGSVSIDASELSTGIYLIRLIDNSAKVLSTQKMIVE